MINRRVEAVSRSISLSVRRLLGRLLFFLPVLCLSMMSVVPAWGQMNEEAILYPDDPSVFDSFGLSVSIFENTAIVGAPRDPGHDWNGAAYIYRFDPVTDAWHEEIKLSSSDGEPGDDFGYSVGLFGDVAVVGAHEDDDNGYASGSAYVFRFDPGTATWIEEAKLLPSDGAASSYFGCAVAIHGDRVVVGALGDRVNNVKTGSACIFRIDPGSGTWKEEAKLLASDGAESDEFGNSVAIQGDVAVVGAPFDDVWGANFGSVYFFRFDPVSGTWTERTKLLPADGMASDFFGESVALFGDVAVIGATGDDSNGEFHGSAYVFRHDPVSGTLIEEAELFASDGASGDIFGMSVAVHDECIVVGARGDDDNGSRSGSAYLFRFDPVSGSWIEEDKLLPANGTYYDQFGCSVALSGQTALIGAPGHSQSFPESGLAYIFDLHRYPLLEIACNGEDQDVIVSGGDKVTLTIDVATRNYTGFRADLWVIGTSFTGGGSWSFGYHGAPSWAPGISKVYFTGGLFDFSATVLDRPLPVGMYIAWLAVDLKPDGWLDMDDLFDYDAVNFVVVP